MFSEKDVCMYQNYLQKRLNRTIKNLAHVRKEEQSQEKESDTHNFFRDGLIEEELKLQKEIAEPISDVVLKREISYLDDHLRTMLKESNDDRPPWSTEKNVLLAKRELAVLLILLQKFQNKL
jgi:uncharacterized membrane protein YheB (UPF0754 family)